MSSSEPSAQPIVMLVAAPTQPGVEEWRTAIESAGASVRIVPDVYTAMAELADDLVAQHVIVDEQILNEGEANFVSLAPQYFATTVHRHSIGNGGVEGLLAALFGGAPKSDRKTQAEDRVDDRPAPVEAKEEIKETEQPEASMHDAVRARMSADAPPPIRRRPPQSRPPQKEVRPQSTETGLSDAELDALLDAGRTMEDEPGDESRELPT